MKEASGGLQVSGNAVNPFETVCAEMAKCWCKRLLRISREESKGGAKEAENRE
jgi:hypothetical protein